jgi:hypothetical protein
VSWCNKLASVPSVGLFLDWHFGPANTVLQDLAPMLLNGEVEHEKPTFTLAEPDPYTLFVRTRDGFNYSFEPSKVSVGFQHSTKVKHASGAPPIMEMLSKPAPYTDLLDEVIDRVLGAAAIAPANKTRKFNKIGVVSTTRVADDECPPGISRFIEYFGAPWGGKLSAYSFQIVTQLGADQQGSDRCIHTIVRTDDPDELLTLTFDWQRSLPAGRAIVRSSMEDIVARARRSALEYFEDLAEGSRFDEVVSVSTGS